MLRFHGIQDRFNRLINIFYFFFFLIFCLRRATISNCVTPERQMPYQTFRDFRAQNQFRNVDRRILRLYIELIFIQNYYEGDTKIAHVLIKKTIFFGK